MVLLVAIDPASNLMRLASAAIRVIMVETRATKLDYEALSKAE